MRQWIVWLHRLLFRKEIATDDECFDAFTLPARMDNGQHKFVCVEGQLSVAVVPDSASEGYACCGKETHLVVFDFMDRDGNWAELFTIHECRLEQIRSLAESAAEYLKLAR